VEGDIQGLNEYVAQAMNVAVNYAPQLALPIVTLIVGLWLIKVVCTALKKAFARSHMEATLQNSIETLMSIGLKALLFISVASMVGVETTSFIAILCAAGLAVGLALQGSLGNFAVVFSSYFFVLTRLETLLKLAVRQAWCEKSRSLTRS